MDRLTFVLVAVAVLLLAGLPFLQGAPPAREEPSAAEPSLASALEEDLRTGKITSEDYLEAQRGEKP